MHIDVRHIPTSPFVADPEYAWDDWNDNSHHLGLVCTHENAEIEPPCCNGNDCACGGVSSVSCDCEEYGFGLSNEDIERILGE